MAATESAVNILAQGKRNMVVGEIPTAVNQFQEACKLLAKAYGETAKECADAYFCYGQALLDLARMENGVLGNALQGVPDTDDDTSEQKDEQFEKADIKVEEREKLRIEVYDAMSEKEVEKEERLKMEEEKRKELGETMEVAMDADDKEEKKGEKEESGKPDDEEGMDEPDDAKANEKPDEGKEIEKIEDKKIDKKDLEEKVEEKKDEKDLEKKDDVEKDVEMKNDTEDLEKRDDVEKDVEMKEDQKLDEKDGKEKDEEKKVEDEMEEDDSEKTEKKDKKEDKKDEEEGSEKEGEDDEDGMEEGTEDGTEGEGTGGDTADEGKPDDEAKPDEEAGEDTASQDGSQDGENPDDISNLQLAWEMLELAKLIYLKDESKEAKLRAAESHLKLGEVSLETEQYEEAVKDLSKCLDIQKEHLDPDNRLLAETYYQLGLAHCFNKDFEKSTESYNNAIKVIEDRVASLNKVLENVSEEEKETKDFDSPIYKAKKEIDELQGILPDIKAKIEDVEDEKKNMEALKNLAKEAVSGLSAAMEAAPSEPVKPKEDVQTTDISHLVKRKRKSEEPDEEVVKKAKQEEKGAGDAQINGIA